MILSIVCVALGLVSCAVGGFAARRLQRQNERLRDANAHLLALVWRRK